MENVFEWAKSVDQKKRKKPNKQLQQELINRINTSMNENIDSCFDCLQALMKFDKIVLEPFYKDYYPNMSDVQQANWDSSLSRWANGVKPTENATIRIASIIREKLQYVQDARALINELRWLSLNDDKRSIKEFEDIRDSSTLANLRKLLSLDASTWASGKAQLQKMYGIMFSESLDAATKQLYIEFLTRHGWYIDSSEKVNDNEDSQPELELNSSTSEVQIQAEPETTSTESKLHLPQGGIALAEALLKWSQDQQELHQKLMTQITDLRQKEQQANAQLICQAKQISSLETALANESKRKEEAECDLHTAQAQIVSLTEEVALANNTIGQVQHMAGNSAKQELDGFKNRLANDLQKTVKDFKEDISDLSEAEMAEVYQALFDELIDTLKHHGVQIEVN